MRLDIFRYSLPLTNLAAQTEFRQPEKDCSGSSKDDALLVYKRPHKSNETLPARVTIPNHRSAHQLGTGCWYYRTVLQSPRPILIGSSTALQSPQSTLIGHSRIGESMWYAMGMVGHMNFHRSYSHARTLRIARYITSVIIFPKVLSTGLWVRYFVCH